MVELTNEQENPLNGTQKNWTQPFYVKTAQDLISRMYDKLSEVFNAHQGKFGSQWLNVVLCKNLGLALDDQQLRISIGLRLGANICVVHTCNCGKIVEGDDLHGLSCTKSAGRFSRHATLNSLMKQTLEPLDLPLVLEPGHCNKFERISSNVNFEWTKCEFSKNRNKFESLCSNFELSIKRASDFSPFHPVHRGPLGPLMFPPC